MNIQTERLENHTARFVVEVEAQQWEDAKKKAAKELSKRYRIPGFRKGKAPYNIVVRYLGEQPIVEDAMEKLGNEVYKDVLEQSEFAPYAPGSIEDFKLEPLPTYTFTVPLQPEVKLGDYREIRLDFEEPSVDDEDVDRAMRELQQRYALVEDSQHPIRVGDRVTLDIHTEFTDGPEIPEEDEETEDAAEDTDENIPYKGESFIHEHDAVINLDPDNEPILPGFIDAMVGANANEDVEFELTVPEDKKEFESIAGRKVQFNISISKVQNVTLPELNDDLAARITADEDEPLNLLQLRMRTREDLEKEAMRNAENTYGNQILDLVVEQAEVSFHDLMVDDRIHDMIHDLDNMLRQQGMTLETYQQVTGTTHEDLHEQYHDEAIQSLKRTLVLSELLEAEKVHVHANDVEAEIDKMLARFGEQAEMFRQIFDTDEQRQNIAGNLLYQKIMDRLVKIGKGETIEEEHDEEPAEEPVAELVAEADDAANEETAAEEESSEPVSAVESDDEQIESEE